MSKQEQRFYGFGPFRLDTADRLLFREGEVVPLTPKAMDTLFALVRNHGRVLERDELMKIVWPDTFVEEGGLARNISLLRKALGEGPDDSRYIETIPRRGYRFVAPVQEVPGVPAGEAKAGPAKAHPRRRWVTIAVLVLVAASALISAYLWRAGWFKGREGGAQVRSLVVLPLENLSGDSAQDYFADGMTDAVLTNLAKISALTVISYPKAKYREGGKSPAEVAQSLKVDAALTGSAVLAGDGVRISARLIRARTGEHLWAQDYEGNVRDILKLQSEVAMAIAREVPVRVTPQERVQLAKFRPVNPEAYENYAKGRFYWDRRTGQGLQTGMGYFQQATEKDPDYAQAYAGLADAYALLGSMPYNALPPKEAMPRARNLAMKALEIDDTLAEAHASLAYVKLSFDWDWPAAEREFQRAIELNPGYATAHHWYAHYFLAVGKLEEALVEMKKAQELDPLSPIFNVGLGWCLYYAREYDQAIREYRRVIETDPGFALAHYTLGLALDKKGLHEEAITEFQRALTLSDDSAGTVAALGYTYAVSGRKQEARAQLEKLRDLSTQKRYVPALYPGFIYAGLGDVDRAFEWAQKGCEERSDFLIYIKNEPSLDSLRPDPRFQDLLRRVGLEGKDARN